MTLFFAFAIAFYVSLISVPLVRRWAAKKSLYDSVDERKIHSGNIPRLGGIGIFLGSFVGLVGASLLGKLLYPSNPLIPSFGSLLLVGVGFHLLGLVDDLKGLRARFKFLVQFALAIAVVALGYRFSVIELPIEPYRIELGIWSYPLTVIWIVGIVNAFNLIDGMDGLAAGITLIGAAIWATLFFKTGQVAPAILACVLAGSLLGFLFFNFPPAIIFMGDSGSLFLGFCMAILPLLGYAQNTMTAGFVPAVTVCLIPILDTLAAILRRWRCGVSFFTPDKYHLHHKLLNLGFTTRQILAIIYGLCFALGACVLAGIYFNPWLSFVLMVGGWALCGGIFVVLHFLKEKKIRLFS